MLNKLLLDYIEFGARNGSSVCFTFEDQPYPGMEKIITYLEKGQKLRIVRRPGIDSFTGNRVTRRRKILTDGTYAWSSMLPYYVRTYNMRLPKVFEQMVLEETEEKRRRRERCSAAAQNAGLFSRVFACWSAVLTAAKGLFDLRPLKRKGNMLPTAGFMVR